MFAILQIGGKQYKVTPDQKLKIDNLNEKTGEKVTFDQVLCLKNEKGETVVGEPFVSGAKAEAEILNNFRDKKVIIFKKRRRKNSRRKRGHRQEKTEIKILSITA